MTPATDIGAILARGLAHHQAGRLAAAEADYRLVLALVPNQPDALHLMGVAAYQTGRLDESIGLYRRALAGQPNYPAALNNFATALKDTGALAEARRAAEKALRLSPDFADGHNTLGNVRLAQGDAAAAAASFRRAITLRPDDAALRTNLGNALVALDELDEAEACYRRAVALAPGRALAWLALGDLMRARSRAADAAEAYRSAIAADPRNALAYNNLGAVLEDLRQDDAAGAAYRAATAADPAMALAWENLSGALRAQGRYEEALQAIDSAIACAPRTDALRLKRALMTPTIIASEAAIEAARRHVEQSVDDLLADNPAVESVETEIGRSVFYLAYHGRDDRPLQEKIARLFRKACPTLSWTAPHCRDPQPATGRRIRFGILSYHLRAHTIGSLNLGLVRALPRERLEVVLLRPPGREDPMSAALDAAADRVVRLPAGLADMRAAVAAQELDVLFYPDIGMDPMTYYLAFARLAPVQCMGWGHPVTTGIDTVDYFLSSDAMEPAGAEACYTETLIRFRDPAVCYLRPDIPEGQFDRAAAGLPAAARLYACPQTLFKFHPAFDAVLAGILRGDERACVVLVNAPHRNWDDLLKARFARTFPDVAGRIQFIAPMPRPAFVDFLATADVLLDPFPFGGGNSAYEAFSVGAPIVTLPGRFMRGRVTHALYRQMGIDDCTAHDADDYVRRALRLACDPDERARVRTLIRERAGALFGRAAAVEPVARFALAAAEAAARGERLTRAPGD